MLISRFNTGTYSNKGSNGFHRSGSLESVIPPKSIFGLMLPQRSQASNSLKSEINGEEKIDKAKLDSQKKDDILMPFPELSMFEEDDSEEEKEKIINLFQKIKKQSEENEKLDNTDSEKNQ